MKHPEPRIRVAGVVTRGDKILLVRHERDGRMYYLLPGGGLEWGETCVQALVREFAEELSVNVSVGKLLLINESIDPKGKRHIVNMAFVAKLKSGDVTVNQDRRLKGAAWLSQKELKTITFYPEIRNALLRQWRAGFKLPATWVDTPWT